MPAPWQRQRWERRARFAKGGIPRFSEIALLFPIDVHQTRVLCVCVCSSCTCADTSTAHFQGSVGPLIAQRQECVRRASLGAHRGKLARLCLPLGSLGRVDASRVLVQVGVDPAAEPRGPGDPSAERRWTRKNCPTRSAAESEAGEKVAGRVELRLQRLRPSGTQVAL